MDTESKIYTPRVKPDEIVSSWQISSPSARDARGANFSSLSIGNEQNGESPKAYSRRPMSAPTVSPHRRYQRNLNSPSKKPSPNPVLEGEAPVYRPVRKQFAKKETSNQTPRGKSCKIIEPSITAAGLPTGTRYSGRERPVLGKDHFKPQEKNEEARTTHKKFTTFSHSLLKRDPLGQTDYLGTESVKNTVPQEYKSQKKQFPLPQTVTTIDALSNRPQDSTRDMVDPLKRQRAPQRQPINPDDHDTAARIFGINSPRDSEPQPRYSRKPFNKDNVDHRNVINYRYSNGICPQEYVTDCTSGEKKIQEARIKESMQTNNRSQDFQANRIKGESDNSVLSHFLYETR